MLRISTKVTEMCRLFGIIANKPVDVRFSLIHSSNSMLQESLNNPDGWGIAWYENNKAKVFKEPLPMYFGNWSIVRHVKSRIIISHVRNAVYGNVSMENTQPFTYENYIFAHNGVIDLEPLEDLMDPIYLAKVKGDTDSERLFYYIIECIDKTGNIIRGIIKAVKSLEDIGFSSLNFVMSDGSKLYALRYWRTSPKYYSLYMLRRPTPLAYHDYETRLIIEHKLKAGEKAVLIASEPLTLDEAWFKIPNKTLVIINSDLKTKIIKVR